MWLVVRAIEKEVVISTNPCLDLRKHLFDRVQIQKVRGVNIVCKHLNMVRAIKSELSTRHTKAITKLNDFPTVMNTSVIHNEDTERPGIRGHKKRKKTYNLVLEKFQILLPMHG